MKSRLYAGAAARSNGNHFEGFLEQCFKTLAAQKLCVIEKTPEPMRPVSAPTPAGTFKAIFTKKAQPDFKGVLAGGRAIVLEAKYCSGTSFVFARVIPEQVNSLQNYAEAGALSFVVVGLAGEVFFLPVADFLQLKCGKKKSANKKDLMPWAVPNVIDYIAAMASNLSNTGT